jgi:hypothetical protein
VPACARFVDGHLGEGGGDLGCVWSEELSLFLSDAAGDIGGADALLWIRGGECGDKPTRCGGPAVRGGAAPARARRRVPSRWAS